MSRDFFPMAVQCRHPNCQRPSEEKKLTHSTAFPPLLSSRHKFLPAIMICQIKKQPGKGGGRGRKAIVNPVKVTTGPFVISLSPLLLGFFFSFSFFFRGEAAVRARKGREFCRSGGDGKAALLKCTTQEKKYSLSLFFSLRSE